MQLPPQPVAALVRLIKGEQVIRAGVEGGLRVRGPYGG